jgi:hypothetical protein
MAGSYQHCRSETGSFTFELIENLGDAHEACEMMYWMIDFLAQSDPSRITQAENAYYQRTR